MTFGEAMLKSQIGAGSKLPTQGTVVITVKNGDKARAVKVAADLHAMGFALMATRGTATALMEAGLPVKVVNKVKDGRPHIADLVKAGEIQLVYTTVDETRTAIADSRYIRTAALANRVTYYTTMAGCEAATEALKHQATIDVASLQELHARATLDLGLRSTGPCSRRYPVAGCFACEAASLRALRPDCPERCRARSSPLPCPRFH